MFPATQGQGLTCSACKTAVSTQSVQRCKDCNKGYCADCFKTRNGLETKAEKTDGDCIPCANLILIVQLENEDKSRFPKSNKGDFSHGTSPSSSQSEQPQFKSKSYWASTKAVSSAYPTLPYEEELGFEDEDDYYGDSLSAYLGSYSRTASKKKKGRACPKYWDKNGKRVPYALILAGIVTEYFRDPPLAETKDFSSDLTSSHQLSYEPKKNKNVGIKKNAQLVEETGREDQIVPNEKGQRSKESSEDGSSGQSSEILEVKNANVLHTVVSSTHSEPDNTPLTDIQRTKSQQKIKSGKGQGQSINVKDFHPTETVVSQHRPGSQHRPPVAMMLAGLVDEKYLQEALSSRVAFLDKASQQFNIVPRFQEHSTGRHDTVVSRQKSQKNKNSVLTKSFTMVNELTENSSETSTEGGSSSGTKMPTSAEDTKQSESYNVEKQSLSLKSKGRSVKEPVKRPQLEDAEDQKRAITRHVDTNRILSLSNCQSMKETYEKQEKLKPSEQDSETIETKGMELSRVLFNKSVDTARGIGSVPEIPKSFINKAIEETDSDSDSDDDVVPYALTLAGITREPSRKRKKTESGSDEPFALQVPNVDKNPPQKEYHAVRFFFTFRQDDEKDTQPDSPIESGNSDLYIITSQGFSLPKVTVIDTAESDLRSTKDGNNGSSEKRGHKNIIKKKNVTQTLNTKVAILDTETGHKTDDIPTLLVPDSGVEDSKSRNVESKEEKLMDEGTENEIDICEIPGNDNMEAVAEGPPEPEAQISNDDSVPGSTLVNFDSSMSEKKGVDEDSLQRVDQSEKATIADSEYNPKEQVITMTRQEENKSVDENGTDTSLAYSINDKLSIPQPDVHFEISSAVDAADEAVSSVMDSDQSRTSLEEGFKQMSQRANIETGTQDVCNKKQEVDDSESQFHSESKSPSQPSGTMKNSYLRQSLGEKEKNGHISKNVTKPEVKTLKLYSANNQQRNKLCDPANVCDIDHSEIHYAFQNIGRKRTQRSTLCCIGCGRPECQSYVMQNILLINQAAKKNGMQVCDVNPDGNCMFTAVVDQLHFQGDYRFDAWNLRQNAVNWLRNNPCSKDGTHYSSFLDSESWEEYLLRLSLETQWGDHVMLRAIVEFLSRTIEVLTPKTTLEFHVTRIEPEFSTPSVDVKSLLLGHIGESHYVSLRLTDPALIEPKENEKSHETEEMEKNVTIDKHKDEEGEKTQRVSPECMEKVRVFEETYFDTWSDCPGIHLSFAIKKTFSPAIVLQDSISASNKMLSDEIDMQEFYPRTTLYQGAHVKMLAGSVIEGLYCPGLDKPDECGVSYDWGEMTEIFVRQDLQIIEQTHLTQNMNTLYMEEDTVHPGFVRLFSASLSIQQAHGVCIPGSTIKYISNNFFKGPKQFHYQSFKYKKFNVKDTVGIRCLYWPTSAEKWESRKRFEGWPPESIIHDIVSEGCLVLPVPNNKSQYPEVVFQISFALAEKKLALNAVSSEQRYCYLIWKAICNQVFKGKNLLEAIYYKTVFFFACETVPAEHWKNHPGPCIFFMFDELLKCIRERNLPCYFLPRNNLLDMTDEEKLKNVEELLGNLRSNVLLYARLLMETTWYRTDILEKVIDNIQKFKLSQSARITALEFFVPETIELAKESVRAEKYKEGYECLMQAYEDRLAVCTCDDQMPINLFIHGAINDVSYISSTWFLLYCDEHFQGQLPTSLMQEISLSNGQELIGMGHILPADICGKYANVQVPLNIARDVCSFCCQFAKYLNNIGSSNHALQVLYYCIDRHKEWEQTVSQSTLTEEENKKMNSKEPGDLLSDFSYYNMLTVYITLHKVYSTRNEIRLLEQHLTDIVNLVEKVGNSSAFLHLSSMLGDLSNKEGKERAYNRYKELHQKEAEMRKEMEAQRL